MHVLIYAPGGLQRVSEYVSKVQVLETYSYKSIPLVR